MNNYDDGAGTHGEDKYWLRRFWQRIRASLDREREIITLRNVVGMMAEARRGDGIEYHQMYEAWRRATDRVRILETHVAAKPGALDVDAITKCRAALSAVLTHFGMDEDEYTKPTFDQVRGALKSIDERAA